VIQNFPDMGQYHVALEYISRCKERLALEPPGTEEAKAKKSKSWWPFSSGEEESAVETDEEIRPPT
jgi:hypothetical protein